MSDPAILSTDDRPFADILAGYRGNEDMALKSFIRNEARRQANAKVQRNAVLDEERDDLCAYFDLGSVNDIALKCQRMDYSFALIRSPDFREACEIACLGSARPAGTYTLGAAG
jgi:hypothetical protein